VACPALGALSAFRGPKVGPDRRHLPRLRRHAAVHRLLAGVHELWLQQRLRLERPIDEISAEHYCRCGTIP
jgi:hypothetical protein